MSLLSHFFDTIFGPNPFAHLQVLGASLATPSMSVSQNVQSVFFSESQDKQRKSQGVQVHVTLFPNNLSPQSATQESVV